MHTNNVIPGNEFLPEPGGRPESGDIQPHARTVSLWAVRLVRSPETSSRVTVRRANGHAHAVADRTSRARVAPLWPAKALEQLTAAGG